MENKNDRYIDKFETLSGVFPTAERDLEALADGRQHHHNLEKHLLHKCFSNCQYLPGVIG